MHKLRVAVLYGGRSGEHEVSLTSAEAVIAAMDPQRYDVQRVLITKEGHWQPRPISPEPSGNPGIDVVFPVLHGTFGEDGTVQGMLEMAGLPYVGAGVLASSTGMDKAAMKAIFRDAGLPVCRMIVARPRIEPTDAIIERIERELGYPCFVKPANLGSLVGI